MIFLVLKFLSGNCAATEHNFICSLSREDKSEQQEYLWLKKGKQFHEVFSASFLYLHPIGFLQGSDTPGLLAAAVFMDRRSSLSSYL